MKIYNKRAKNNSELGLEACLYFDDSVLLARNAPGLLDELGLAHKRFTVLGESMAGLRNDLAHGGTIIDRADSPVTALRTLRDVRELAHRAAGLASQEPDRPELYSQTTIVDEDGRFYGGGAQVVEMGDGDAGGHTLFLEAQHARGGGAVPVKGPPLPPEGGRRDERLPVHDIADMGDEGGIADGEDAGLVIFSAFMQAFDAGTVGRREAGIGHCRHSRQAVGTGRKHSRKAVPHKDPDRVIVWYHF